ncbi:DDE superfamily endonuclease [Rhizoctonia solani]|uniref:DDE superfamily endonuclease n=1 Tax=Rhizoctonia solani TaxID=456999 RepID=A0A8H8NUE1_9AGAM|nr:DDE superfamily endonuclease [Rhizoctonia solani]QRW19720.1 DDE superfamily endonuclease [Rhizoctonia solani]
MTISNKKRQQLQALEKARANQKRIKTAHFDNEDNNNKSVFKPLDLYNDSETSLCRLGVDVVYIAPDPCGSELDHPPAYPNSPNSFDSDSSDSEGDSNSGSSSGELPWELSYYRPPTVAQAQTALATLDSARRTQLPSGGYKYKDLDRITAERYTAIQACLNQFLEAEPKGKKFIQASKDAARMHNRRDTYAQTIRWWNVSTLEDEDVSSAIRLHLQKAGKLAGAQDVVDFLSDPEVYIPFLKKIERRQIIYNRDGVEDPTRPLQLLPGKKPIILWFHDETIFYANDRRKVRWVFVGESPVPHKKGEGCSLMVADFVCAEFGWLRGPNGESARVTMFPGGDKDGWFTNDRVILQLEDAVKIVNEHFPQFTHIFVYDNAPSHTKRSLSSLSAYGMPKGPLLDWPYYKDKDDKRVFVRMENGFLPDGSPQEFYDPNEPNRFKGMSWILRERGLGHLADLNAVCTKGCEPGKTDCCCRWVMMNQPDFNNRESGLQEAARELGTEVVFLPKYHCELSMIEQVWGYAKRDYRDNPPNSSSKKLKENALKALESPPILSMRKFAARSQRFADGYDHGMDGSQAAAWATTIFKHHRETPAHIPYNEIAPNYVHTTNN